MTKSVLSQEVSVEVVGTDTFPSAIVYHGVPVAAFTDKQMTTIAETFESNITFAAENIVLQQKTEELQNVIKEKDKQITDISFQLGESKKSVLLLKKNEVDYKGVIQDDGLKYKAQKRKGRLRTALCTTAGILFGGGLGFIAGTVHH
jgi:hypothetical protein